MHQPTVIYYIKQCTIVDKFGSNSESGWMKILTKNLVNEHISHKRSFTVAASLDGFSLANH